MPNLIPIAVLDYRARSDACRAQYKGCRESDNPRAQHKGCRDSDNPDLPNLEDVPPPASLAAVPTAAGASAIPPTRVASPFVQDDDALYDEGPSPLVRRYKQALLQVAPVAPVESPVATMQCDHPMLVCSAGFSLIEDFNIIPECPDCSRLVHYGHRGVSPELCGCDDYLDRYLPDY